MAMGYPFSNLGGAQGLLGSLGILGGLAAQGQSMSGMQLDRLQMSADQAFFRDMEKSVESKVKSLEKTIIQELQDETDEWLKDIE